MKEKLEERIIAWFKLAKRPATAHELARSFEVSKVTIHKHLKSLVRDGTLIKQGAAPRVFYKLAENHRPVPRETGLLPDLDTRTRKLIDENFTLILSDGYEITGYEGFQQWCMERGYDIATKAREYVTMFNEYSKFKRNGIINASQKVAVTFPKEERFLNHLYFLEPYSLPVFGKTKISNWLFHGKQTQNKILMKRVLDMVVPKLRLFIEQESYDAVAFVPPSVPRAIQFMKELERTLATTLPVIKIEKIKTPIIIQQKSLKDLNDRVKNAASTMVVAMPGHYEKVLIIDDFTGSGATLNVIAQKIKEQGVAKTAEGLTITGSMNGFEVIREI